MEQIEEISKNYTKLEVGHKKTTSKEVVFYLATPTGVEPVSTA